MSLGEGPSSHEKLVYNVNIYSYNHFVLISITPPDQLKTIRKSTAFLIMLLIIVELTYLKF